jgi:hypothetical protein
MMKRNAVLLPAVAGAVLCVLSIIDSLIHAGARRCDKCRATMSIDAERHDEICDAVWYECLECGHHTHEHEWRNWPWK